MHNGKLDKKSPSENIVHLRQVHIQKRIVMYNYVLSRMLLAL